jgi:hypothetical protein
MVCIDHNLDQEQAHYHFALSEIVYYISQYGIDSVMTDIYNMIDVEKNDAKQQELKALWLDLESRN